jgi:hypothetical protein
MLVLAFFVLASEQRISFYGEKVVSDMKALFWDEEAQTDLDPSPLHQAILPEVAPLQEPQMRLLMGYLNAKDTAGLTPLMWAAIRSDTESLRVLLEHGADLSLKGHGGATALHFASAYGTEADIRLLLKHGASPHTPDASGFQPLHWAVESIHGGGIDPRGKIEALIENGADVNVHAFDGTPPIFRVLECRGRDAFYSISVDVARILVESCSDPQPVIDSLVASVVLCDNVLLTRYLLDIGANLRVRPLKSSSTLFHQAAGWSSPEMWDLLKDLVNNGYFGDLETALLDSNGCTPWSCFENWRYQYAHSDLAKYDLEKEKFGELMEAVQRAVPTKPVHLLPPPPREVLLKSVPACGW